MSTDPVSDFKDNMSATRMPNLHPPNPEHHAHVVQFYTDDRFLLDELTHFIGPALAAGNSAVVIATKGHRLSLFEKLASEKLAGEGIDLAKAVADGRYVALDAAETLARITVGGLPDAVRFSEILGGVIARAATAAQDEHHRVVAFGEMVALAVGGRKIRSRYPDRKTLEPVGPSVLVFAALRVSHAGILPRRARGCPVADL